MKFYVLDIERTIATGKPTYWRKSQYGYTDNIEEAGQFEYENALALATNDVEMKTALIPVDLGLHAYFNK